MLICGVDEAGRGSMVGPLVIAGVSVKQHKVKKLSSLGVKDSKKLTPEKRRILFNKITKFADSYCIAKIYPKTIDRSVKKHKLNFLEARYMAKVISKLKPSVSYVDCCDVNPKRFGNYVAKLSDSKIKSYHHADDKFAVVSAASIIAKVTRDRTIKRLHKNHDLGSGYPVDLKTVNFVSEWITTKREIPSFVRSSWKPVRNLVALNQFVPKNFATTIA